MRPPSRAAKVALTVLLGGVLSVGLPVARVAGHEPEVGPVPPPPSLKPEGVLTFDVRDAAGGVGGIPCKLTLIGVDGSPDPEFTRNDIGRPEGDAGDAIAAYNRIMSLSGIGGAHGPLGTYDITISRGPEWDIHTERRVK